MIECTIDSFEQYSYMITTTYICRRDPSGPFLLLLIQQLRLLFSHPTAMSNSVRAYLAGLYRYEEHCSMQVPMFSILTRESVAPVRTIHDRIPLILGKENLKEWIRPDSDPRSIAEQALTNMVMVKAKDYPEPVPAFM